MSTWAEFTAEAPAIEGRERIGLQCPSERPDRLDQGVMAVGELPEARLVEGQRLLDHIRLADDYFRQLLINPMATAADLFDNLLL